MDLKFELGAMLRQEQNIEGLDYTFSCQTHGGESNDEYRAIMFEEAFHMLNEGWADVYPDIFGYDSFQSSLICRETASHQCVSPGWWHPENKCPNGAPFTPGKMTTRDLTRLCAFTIYNIFWNTSILPRKSCIFSTFTWRWGLHLSFMRLL